MDTLRRPPNMKTADWEQTILDKVDAVIMRMDASTGNYGKSGVAWVEQQFGSLKRNISGLFTSKEES